jgi:hypothetical protein
MENIIFILEMIDFHVPKPFSRKPDPTQSSSPQTSQNSLTIAKKAGPGVSP